MNKKQEPDNFNLLVKYEKWVVWLFAINFLYRLIVGQFYYWIEPIRYVFIFLIIYFLFKLIDVAKKHFKSSWSKKIGLWQLGAVFFQLLIAPIFMHLIAYHFKGKEEQKSVLQGNAIICDVFVVLIIASVFIFHK